MDTVTEIPEERRYLLRPNEGIVFPRDAPEYQVGCREEKGKQIRVVEDGQAGRLVVEHPDGTVREETLSQATARKMVETFEPQVVRYRLLESGAWKIRIYTGRFWGLVIGVYRGEEDIPEPPDRFDIDGPLADKTEFSQASLAQLNQLEALDCIRSLGVAVETG